MTIRRKTIAASVIAVAAATSAVSADYIITPMSGGGGIIEVVQGGSFDLDIMLSSDAGDVHTSSIFRVEFSKPGLMYTSYLWSSPYETGSVFDDSSPWIDDLAVILDDMTLSGTGYADGIVDVELSNVIQAGAFGDGLLATLSLTVPEDYELGSLFIDVVPDTIANGFDEISTASGESFELIVVPGPGGAVLLAWGVLSRRRRFRTR